MPIHGTRSAATGKALVGRCAVPRVHATDLTLLACVAVWGLNVATTKYAFGHGFSPLSFAGPQFAIMTLTFVLLAWRRDGGIRLDRRDVRRLALWGGVVFSTNWIAFSWSVEFASAATVALLMGTMPIFAALFSQLLGIERLDGRRWLAALVSFSGVGLVAVGATTGLHASVGGILLTLYAPASFALYSIVLAPLVRRHGTLRVNTVSSLFCLPVLLAAATPELAQTDWGAISGLAWSCLAFSALSFAPTNMLWFAGVAKVGTARASVFLNLQPFFGAIAALLLLSEEILALQWIGGIVIVAGIALARTRAARPGAVVLAAPAARD
jgi:drug/metabolite transporter (DMT)-like permease